MARRHPGAALYSDRRGGRHVGAPADRQLSARPAADDSCPPADGGALHIIPTGGDAMPRLHIQGRRARSAGGATGQVPRDRCPAASSNGHKEGGYKMP